MDKQTENTLKNFEAVWKRVAESKSVEKASSSPKHSAALMPRKGGRPSRRFEGNR